MPNLEIPCKVLFYSAEGDQPGFDHNFVVSRDWEAGTRLAAVVRHPPSGRQLEVFSNQPGLQFYTGVYTTSNQLVNSSTSCNLTSGFEQASFKLKCLSFEQYMYVHFSFSFLYFCSAVSTTS
jgi:galactose mutarotase-like enzyme